MRLFPARCGIRERAKAQGACSLGRRARAVRAPFPARRLIPHATALLALFLAGCYTTVSQQRTTTASDFPKKWSPAVSLHQAQSLSPDEAKAILIARAAVEEFNQNMREPPGILSLTPERDGDGWSVHVTFVGAYSPDGTPAGGPGYFCVVHIDKDWKMTGITGGT